MYGYLDGAYDVNYKQNLNFAVILEIIYLN